jgi:hypothetical protein
MFLVLICYIINFNLIIYLFNEDYYQTLATSSSPYYIYYFFNVVIVLTNLSLTFSHILS